MSQAASFLPHAIGAAIVSDHGATQLLEMEMSLFVVFLVSVECFDVRVLFSVAIWHIPLPVLSFTLLF